MTELKWVQTRCGRLRTDPPRSVEIALVRSWKHPLVVLEYRVLYCGEPVEGKTAATLPYAKLLAAELLAELEEIGMD